MRAAVSARYGGPDVVDIRDLPRPEPGRGEVLVGVHASTVSRTDCGMLRAHPWFARPSTGLLRPKVKTLGIDFAGTVIATGRDVAAFSPGDRVFGLSAERFGAHAEFLALPADGAIARIPDRVGFREAVVCEGAWYAEMTVGRLAPGQRILIYGASGAIGTAAVQLARAAGAHVAAVVAPRHVDLARALGADRVVDYTSQDFTAIGETFHIVFDAVGKTSYAACRRLLAPGGVYCATDLGPWWSNIWLSFAHAAVGRPRVEIPFPKESRAFVHKIRDLMAEGRYRGVFDRDYPLDAIAEAYRYVETGQKTGIVTLNLEPDAAPPPDS